MNAQSALPPVRHGDNLGAALERAHAIQGHVIYQTVNGGSVFDEGARVAFWSIPPAPRPTRPSLSTTQPHNAGSST